jgi:hypothetical protein
LILIVGNCWVRYEGRASSQLSSGERILILKPDGSVLLHRSKDYSPVNWQPPGSLFRTSINKGNLYIRSYRRKENEVLEVFFDDIILLSLLDLEDTAEFIMYASEEDMHNAIILDPDILEKGFRPIKHEYQIEPGFVDILGMDKEGNLVVVEIKRNRANKDAVHQLKKYMEVLDLDPSRRVRGILVAPDIASGVQELLAIYGFEFKQLSPSVCTDIINRNKRQTLTDFFN